MMSYATGLVCLYCGATYGLEPLFAGCPKCQTEKFHSNLTVQYDYGALRGKIGFESFHNRRPGIWRFSDLLPIENPSHFLTIHEGNTPLVPLIHVAKEARL